MTSPVRPANYDSYRAEDWEKYFSSEEGVAYLESFRNLVHQLFSWELEVSDVSVSANGEPDTKRSAALTQMQRMGEIEIVGISTLVHTEKDSRRFKRRSLS